MTIDVDPEALRQLDGLMGEDGGDLVAELIDLFTSTTAETLARLRAAVARGDAVEARRHAHSIKGSAQTMGAASLAALAREAEELAGAQRMEDVLPLADRMGAALGPTVARLREITAGR